MNAGGECLFVLALIGLALFAMFRPPRVQRCPACGYPALDTLRGWRCPHCGTWSETKARKRKT
jgi:rubrerythrin